MPENLKKNHHNTVRARDGYPIENFVRNPYGEAFGGFPVQLRFAGRTIWKKGVRCIRHGSPCASAELVRSGCFSYGRNGRTFPVHPGELMFLQPLADTEMRCESSFAEKYVFAFSGPGLPGILSLLDLSHLDTMTLPDCEKWERFAAVADHLLKNCGHSGISSPAVRTASFAYRLLLELSEIDSMRGFPGELRRALDFLHRELENAPTLNDLIAESGLSRMTLFRLFSKHLGTNPMAYARELRMNRAAELLRDSGLSVKEISVRLNCASPQYFSSEFRKRFGVAPRDFRKQ